MPVILFKRANAAFGKKFQLNSQQLIEFIAVCRIRKREVNMEKQIQEMECGIKRN